MAGGLTWILAGLLSLAGELLLPGIYLLWAGLAAIGTGLLVLALAPPFALAVAAFLLLLALGISVALRRPRRRAGDALLNTPEAGLVGRVGVLLPDDGPGMRVRLGDSDWPARLADAPGRTAGPLVGARVRVESVDGLVLTVRPEP